MWKLPNGRTINVPRGVSIDGINHPADIFFRWSIAELNAIGIYPFVEENYLGAYYRSTAHEDTITDGTMFRTHTLENKYTGQELRAKFIVGAKRHLKQLWKKALEELEYLETFDPDNTIDHNEWTQYKSFLKAAFTQAKAELQEITDYEAGVEFVEIGFYALLPTTPDQLEEV